VDRLRSDYDAWGVITLDTAPTFQSLGYAGGLEDRATGLGHLGTGGKLGAPTESGAPEPHGPHSSNSTVGSS